VKRRALIKELTAAGCQLLKRGKKHDIYRNPRTGQKAPVLRHTEVANTLVNLIKKQLGLTD
jgi:predicted RNA binding protein YcfA (HicA-like mRNA interferase family)